MTGSPIVLLSPSYSKLGARLARMDTMETEEPESKEPFSLLLDEDDAEQNVEAPPYE